MALLIAPLFTAGIAVGGIQNVYAGVQDWTVTLTNTNTGKTVTWTNAEFGDCTGEGVCTLPFTDGKLRKCDTEMGREAFILFTLNTNPVVKNCNGPWTVTLQHAGLTDVGFTHAFIIFQTRF